MISRRYCLNLWRVEQKVPQVKQVQVQQEQEVNEMRSQLVFHCQAPPCHCMLMSRLLTQSQHGYICKQCKDGYGIGYFLLTNVLCGRDFIGLSDEWLNKFRGQLGKEEAPVYFPPQPFCICDCILICIWIFICPQPFCICDGICICPQLFYVCVGILICIWSSFLTESAVFIILIFWGKFF